MSANIEIIFATARELQPVDRDGYLDEACAGDEKLRAQVEALLAADADAGSFLQSAEHDPDATLTMTRAMRDSKIPAEQEGQLIDRYKLLQQIGEGGFGTVWMAEQKQPVKRRIALKIIKLGMDTKLIIARFEAERQALAMMDHPNIAKVFDAGSTDSGRPYFVMELVRGIPILEYCDTEKLDTKSRLKLFMLVCNAIQHSHQKGIIHRDIKPSNVLVTLHDGEPVPKVIDFGIAKATNQELTQKTLYTEFNQMVGTPAYMSPEQAEMSGLDIDTRSDIYSLGVLLYELLTGTTPFDHKELMDRGFAEMMRVIREETPHKPSTRLSTLGDSETRTAEQRHTDLKKLGTVLRGDLDWIVMRCLEKNRTRRYDTATGLAADINRHLNNEPVEAGPPSAGYKMRKFVRRNKGMVMAGSAVAAVLLMGIAGTTWQWREAILARHSVETQRDIATRQRDLVERSLRDVVERVSPMIGQTSAYTIDVSETVTMDGGKKHTDFVSVKSNGDVTPIVNLHGADFKTNPNGEFVELGSSPPKFETAVSLLKSFTFDAIDQGSQALDAAEWSSYTVNLALAQMAMDNGNWPEARDRIAACPESKRGWEWEFLSKRADTYMIELPGRLIASPNGKYLLSYDYGERIQLRDMDGKRIGSPMVNENSVGIASFSPDGNYVMAVSDVYEGSGSQRFNNERLNAIQVWDLNGQPVGVPMQYRGWAKDARFGNDGRSILTTSRDNTVRQWDLSGKVIREIRDPEWEKAPVLSPDDSQILAIYKDHTVQIIDWDGSRLSGPMPMTTV